MASQDFKLENRNPSGTRTDYIYNLTLLKRKLVLTGRDS